MQVIENPAGRTHNDVHPFFQTAQLFRQRSATINRRDRQFSPRIKRQQLFGDLQGKLPGRNKYQALYRTSLFGKLVTIRATSTILSSNLNGLPRLSFSVSE